MLLLNIACILVIILSIAFILMKYKFIERFETNLDPHMLETNGLEYIINELKWEIDYNINKFLPDNIKGKEFIQDERIKIISARRSILSEFDAVKYKIYGGINISYPYSQACILRNNRILKNVTKTSDCQLSGQILTYDIDNNSKDGKYGKRKTIDVTVQMLNFDDYIRFKINSEMTARDISSALKNNIHPSDGCIIETYDKDVFFDKITLLAQMSMYEDEYRLNNQQIENQKEFEKNKSLTNVVQLYGITKDATYDSTLLPSKCRTVTTNPIKNIENNYKQFTEHDIVCASDEALSSVEYYNRNNKSYYKYKCCKPQMTDNRITMQREMKPKYTEAHKSDSTFTKPWDINTDMNCDNYLNRFRLEIFDIDEKTKKDRYIYECSRFKKNSKYKQKTNTVENDQRQIYKTCETNKRRTKDIPMINGTLSMDAIKMDCDVNYISNIKKKINNNNTYYYEYNCCTPLVNFAV